MVTLPRLRTSVLLVVSTFEVTGAGELRNAPPLDCPRALSAPRPSRATGEDWSLLQLGRVIAQWPPLGKGLQSTTWSAVEGAEPYPAEDIAPARDASPQSPRPALVDVAQEAQEASNKSSDAATSADDPERWRGVEWLLRHVQDAAQAARSSSTSLPADFPPHIELPLIGVISFLSMLVMTVTGCDQQIVFQWGWYVASIFGLASGRFTESVSIISIWPLPLQMQKAWELRKNLNRTLGLTWGFTASIVSIPGVMVLVGHDNAQLKTAFGVLLLLVFAWEACLEWRLARKHFAPLEFDVTWRRLPLVMCTGIIAGALSGLFATPNPAFTIFVLLTRIGREEFLSTKVFVMAVFLPPVRILALAGFGLNVAALKWHYLAGFVGGLVGLVLGDSLSKHGSHSNWRCVALFLQLLFGVTFVCAQFLPLRLWA